jgi:hypothetical protein
MAATAVAVWELVCAESMLVVTASRLRGAAPMPVIAVGMHASFSDLFFALQQLRGSGCSVLCRNRGSQRGDVGSCGVVQNFVVLALSRVPSTRCTTVSVGSYSTVLYSTIPTQGMLQYSTVHSRCIPGPPCKYSRGRAVVYMHMLHSTNAQCIPQHGCSS